MSNGVRVIVDISEAEKLFDSLDVRKQNNIIRSAIRKSLTPILQASKDAFKSEFDTHAGKAYDSLGLQMFRRGLGAAIGARVNKKHTGYYPRFLDLGTKQRFKKSGATTGKIHPSLFFNSNASAKDGKAAEDLADSIIWALNKQIKAGKI